MMFTVIIAEIFRKNSISPEVEKSLCQKIVFHRRLFCNLGDRKNKSSKIIQQLFWTFSGLKHLKDPRIPKIGFSVV